VPKPPKDRGSIVSIDDDSSMMSVCAVEAMYSTFRRVLLLLIRFFRIVALTFGFRLFAFIYIYIFVFFRCSEHEDNDNDVADADQNDHAPAHGDDDEDEDDDDNGDDDSHSGSNIYIYIYSASSVVYVWFVSFVLLHARAFEVVEKSD
jgi:hypothetical protein